MKLWSNSFDNDAPMPEHLAFGAYDPDTHVRLVDNKNPHLGWSDLPAGTKSLVLLCCDPDVPSKPDDVNQEGRTVPKSLARVDFYHWVLVDVQPTPGNIAEGAFANGVVPRGKPGPSGPDGTRQGINSYTDWFAGDDDMKGDYYGYDGPCPPWNDELVHRYVFTLYALDTDKCPVEGDRFDGPAVKEAIEGHVLGQASITGTYAIYPEASTK